MERPTILIVDDDPLITEMLGMVLDLYLDVTVIAFQSPAQALEQFSSQPISLLITDYLMPEMSGLELVRAIREKGFATPAIILTGYFDVLEISRNKDAIAPYEIQVKPWNNASLVERINTYIKV